MKYWLEYNIFKPAVFSIVMAARMWLSPLFIKYILFEVTVDTVKQTCGVKSHK